MQLTVEDERRLYRHYGLATDTSGEQIEVDQQPGAISAHGRAEAGAVAPTRADPDLHAGAASPPSRVDPQPSRGGAASGAREDAMTRSEEEVRIGKRTRERGRVRLKKYVVTDYVETKVPVRREEVRLEREPPDESDPRR